MRKSKKPLKLVTLRLYDGDTDTIARFYPQHGHNVIIREKVHQFCNALIDKEREVLAKTATECKGLDDVTIGIGDFTIDNGEDGQHGGAV